MTAVSGDSTTDIAAKGMTVALNRAEQKSVCASVLRQAEERVDTAKMKRIMTKLIKEVQKPSSSEGQAQIMKALMKLTNVLFPPKKA